MEQKPLMLPRDEFNKTLINNVHPAGWKNPGPAVCYNLVVIGGGTAGLVCAAGAAGLGAKVALIERRLMGGDCLNAGCVPSKGLIRAGRAAHDVKTAGAFGIHCGPVSIDFGAAMERMRSVRAGLSFHDSAARFSKELGVDVFLSSGKFAGPDRIEADGKVLVFKKAAICTGARAAAPPVPGIEQTGYLTNENIFWLTTAPARLLVIGGGPIGCELSQAFARMGSDVTIVEAAGRLLSREDADAATIVQQALLRDSVKLVLNAKVLKAEKRGADKVLLVERQGTTRELAGDELLVRVGRAPNVERLNLILGATIVARHAGEMINELSLAITAGLGLSAIGRTIHPYPTQAEAIKKLADQYNRTRLTPFVKKLFTAWLAWQRS